MKLIKPNRKLKVWPVLYSAMLMFLVGCSSTTEVKTTQLVPLIQEMNELSESELLDVGVLIFDPGLAIMDDDDENALVFEEIRTAEARYFPSLLMSTIQTSAAWGAVRVIPHLETVVDVVLQGTIHKSDGEMLSIDVVVTDATGNRWYQKRYDEKASKYAYDKKRELRVDPFQNIYNRIANDLLIHRRDLSSAQANNIRSVAELRFAQMFSPETFNGYVNTGKNGGFKITKLPADGDPMLTRIRNIRERDYLFIDTLQEYYGSFAKNMKQPYQNWRKESYNEVMAMRSLQRSATNNKLAGMAAILAGVLGVGKSGSRMGRAAGSVAIAGGSYILKKGFDKDTESQIHVEALQELGDSLESSIAPQIIELEDRTVTLSGSVSNQYRQWRNILKQIYEIDNGLDGSKSGQQ